MSKRYTEKSFIQMLQEQFLDKYDFSKTKYVSSSEYIIVTCKLHGDFTKKANALQQGKGCPKCISESIRVDYQITLLDKLTKIFKDTLNLSKIHYTAAKQNVTVICPSHGEFQATPDNLCNGKGCRKCGNIRSGDLQRKTQKKFIKDSIKRYGDIYEYSKTAYLGSKIPVIITCKEHGDFSILPNNHLNGSGCRGCKKLGGFKDNSRGWLYTLSFEEIIKVGITNRKPYKRCRDVSNASGLDFKIIYAWSYEQGYYARKIESLLLNKLRQLYSNPDMKFDGYTECFVNVPKDWVENEVKNLHQITIADYNI